MIEKSHQATQEKIWPIEELVSKERFEHLKEVQITSLEMPPENLLGKAILLDTLAFQYEGDFERIAKRIQAIKDLSYEEFLQNSKDFLSKSNSCSFTKPSSKILHCLSCNSLHFSIIRNIWIFH